MGKNITKVFEKKQEAMRYAKMWNNMFKKRGINREFYVTPISKRFIQNITRKGYKVKNRNYAVAVRNIRRKK